jgi:hypothetical protein
MTGPPVSLEGRTVRMARTGTVVSVGPRLGEGGQGVVHEAALGRGFGCAVKWYRAAPRPAELRRSIAALAERGRHLGHRAGERGRVAACAAAAGRLRRGLLLPRLGRSRPGPAGGRLLELPGGSVVLSGVITAHHLRRDRDYDTVVATVEAYPARPGQVILRNVGAQSWVVQPDGEGAKTVEPGRRLAARAMTIDFGRARGRILGIRTAGTRPGHAPAGEGER